MIYYFRIHSDILFPLCIFLAKRHVLRYMVDIRVCTALCFLGFIFNAGLARTHKYYVGCCTIFPGEIRNMVEIRLNQKDK